MNSHATDVGGLHTDRIRKEPIRQSSALLMISSGGCARRGEILLALLVTVAACAGDTHQTMRAIKSKAGADYERGRKNKCDSFCQSDWLVCKHFCCLLIQSFWVLGPHDPCFAQNLFLDY